MTVLIVMGVCGSGKSTVGEALSQELKCTFQDGDAYHPAANVEKMKVGLALTDEDRIPWLLALHRLIVGWVKEGKTGVVTCSALKKSYRRILLHGSSDAHKGSANHLITDSCLFVVLHGTKDAIAAHMAQRRGHFMPSSLLDSQLAALELPDNDENHVMCAVEQTVIDSVQQVMLYLRDNCGLLLT